MRDVNHFILLVGSFDRFLLENGGFGGLSAKGELDFRAYIGGYRRALQLLPGRQRSWLVFCVCIGMTIQRPGKRGFNCGSRTRTRNGPLGMLPRIILLLAGLALVGCASVREVAVQEASPLEIPATGNAHDVYPSSDGFRLYSTTFFADDTRLLVVTYLNPFRRAFSRLPDGREYGVYRGVWIEILDTADGMVLDRKFIDLGSQFRIRRPLESSDGNGLVLLVGEQFVVSVSADDPDTVTIDEASSASALTTAAVAAGMASVVDPVSTDGTKAVRVDNDSQTIDVYERRDGGDEEPRPLGTHSLQPSTYTGDIIPVTAAGWINNEQFYVLQRRRNLSDIWLYTVGANEPELILTTRDFWERNAIETEFIDYLDNIQKIVLVVTGNSIDSRQLWSLAVDENDSIRGDHAVGLPDGVRAWQFEDSPGLEQGFVTRNSSLEEAAAHVWDSTSLTPLYGIVGSARVPAQTIGVDRSGTRLALGYPNGTVDLWNLVERRPIWTSDSVGDVTEPIARLPEPGVRTEVFPDVQRTVTRH